MKSTLLALSIAMALPFGAAAQTTEQRSADGTLLERRQTVDGRTWITRFHANGRISETGAFQLGLRDGLWKRYDEQGRCVARARFSHGQRDGIWVMRHADGSKHRIRYRANDAVMVKHADARGELVVEGAR